MVTAAPPKLDRAALVEAQRVDAVAVRQPARQVIDPDHGDRQIFGQPHGIGQMVAVAVGD